MKPRTASCVAVVGTSKQGAAGDALILALVTIITALPYVFKLGFYADDWFILSMFDRAAEAGWTGPFKHVFTYPFLGRPGQAIHFAILYDLFGRNPLGYHLVNTCVIAAVIVLFYLLLRRIGVSQFDSISISLIAIIVPQLSTVRVWLATSQISLSLFLCLISIHLQFSYALNRQPIFIVLAVAAAALSLTFYETFIPLLVGFNLSLVFLCFGGSWRPSYNSHWKDRAVLLFVSGAVVVVMLMKAAASDRMTGIADPMYHIRVAWYLIRPDFDWRTFGGVNIYAAVDVGIWQTLVAWARGAKMFSSGALPFMAVAVTLSVMFLAFWRLKTSKSPQDGLNPASLSILGATVFGLSHAMFLIVAQLNMSPTGIGNRVLVGVGLGVAILFVGLIRLAGLSFPDRYSRLVLLLTVTTLVGAGVSRSSQVAAHWVSAWDKQQRVLASAKLDLDSVPPGANIILDGVCAYDGPAIVFESWIEAGPAMSYALGRQILGDTVSERTVVTPYGLQSSIYNEPRLYRYGPQLYIYNIERRLLVPVPNKKAAVNYFASVARSRCPRGYVGHGVLV